MVKAGRLVGSVQRREVERENTCIYPGVRQLVDGMIWVHVAERSSRSARTMWCIVGRRIGVK